MQQPEYQFDDLEFPRWGQSVPVAIERDSSGKDAWVPVRPVTEMLGVSLSTQLRVLQAEVNAGHYGGFLRPILMRNKGVWREYMCLHRSKVPRWLNDIDASKVRKDASVPLREFQEAATKELDRLLFKYRGKAGERGILLAQHTTSIVFVCDCGRHWRIVDENGEWYAQKLEPQEV